MASARFRPACEIVVSNPPDAALDLIVAAFTGFRVISPARTLPIALRFGSVVANTVAEIAVPPLNMLPFLQAGTVIITTAPESDTTVITVALRSSSSLWLMSDRVFACMTRAVEAVEAAGLLVDATPPFPSVTLPKGHPGRARAF